MDGLGLEYSDNLGPGFCFPARANGSNCTDENFFFFISGHSEHFLFLFNCTDGLVTILPAPSVFVVFTYKKLTKN